MKFYGYFSALAILLFVGCATVQPVSPTTLTAQTQNTITIDVAAVLTPILAHNPSYKPLVLSLGTQLPGLLASGPITPDIYTRAVASLPGVSAQQSVDLNALGAVLDLALQSYSSYSGKGIVLYTDPNVKVIVDGFAAALVQAASQ